MAQIQTTGQTFETICRLSPTQPHEATITLVTIKERDDVLVLSTGNNLVYLVQNYTIKAIIDVYSAVIKVLKCSFKEHILVATKDGKLWAIPINSSEHPPEANKMESIDIFDDLLMENQSEMIVTSDSPVSQCRAYHLIHWQQGLHDVTITNNYLIFYTRTEEATLSVYRILEGNSDKPMLLSPLQNLIQLTPNGLPDNTKVTILQCVCHDISTQTRACITLEQQLFRTLFKTDTSNSVVLLGQDSGAVSFILFPGLQNPSLDETTPKLLCHLEQAMVAIFGVCLRESANQVPDTLVLVGALGKVVLVSEQDPSGGTYPGGVQFREYHIPGQVMTSAQSNALTNDWFYSTLGEIYHVQFKPAKQSGPNTDSFPVSLSPVEMKVPNVCALTFNESSSNQGEIALFCMKLDGRVLFLSTSHASLSTRLFGAECGSSIKHYLTQIQKKSEDVQNLATEIRELDNIIRKLNAATHLFCEIIQNRDKAAEFNREVNHGIAFGVTTRYEEQGACPPRVILDCELMNHTKYAFTPCWYMVVQVQTKQPWYNNDGQNIQIVNHSVPLSNSTVNHLSVALDQNISFSPPIQVSCFVYYDAISLISCKLATTCELDLDNGFCTLVKNVQLNVLSFLRTVNTSSNTVKVKSPCEMFQNTLGRFNSSVNTKETAQKSSVRLIHLSEEAVAWMKRLMVESGLVGKNVLENISDEQCILRFLLSNSEQHLTWPEVVNSNFIVVQTADGYEVRFQVVRSTMHNSTTEDHHRHHDSFEVRVFSSHEEELSSSLHAALLHVLNPVLERNSETDFKIPVALLQKHLSQLKCIQTKLELLRAPCRNRGENTVKDDTEDKEYLEKVMAIFRELREIPTLVF